MNGPRRQSSPGSPGPQVAPVPGSTTIASNPGAGRPKDPRRCSGWSDSSSLTRHTLPASVMPSIAWRRSGFAGRTPSGMIGKRFPRRIEDRSRRGEARVARQMGDGLGEPVDHRRPLALEHVEHAGGVRSVRADQSAAGDERAQERVGEPADPEERRVGEQHLVGRVAADLVQVVEVADQRAVRVDHALRLAGRARGVHDREPVAGADVRFRRLEDAGLDRPPALLDPSHGPRRIDVRAGLDEGDVPQHRQRAARTTAERRRSRARGRRHAARPRSRAIGTMTRSAATRRRRCEEARASSALVEKVLSGTLTAPIRAAASQATTNSLPLGWRMPTCVPLPAPAASRPRASGRRSALGGLVRQDVVVAGQEDGRAARLDPRVQQRGDGERQPVAGVDRRRGHAPTLRGETAGSWARLPATALICASQSTIAVGHQPRRRRDPAVLGRTLDLELQLREERGRPPIRHRE